MFDKIKAWASAPTTYDLGLARGFSIGIALGLAMHNAGPRPVLACLWAANAALFAFGARRERQHDAAVRRCNDQVSKDAFAALHDMRAERDRWKAAATERLGEIERLATEIAERDALGRL